MRSWLGSGRAKSWSRKGASFSGRRACGTLRGRAGPEHETWLSSRPLGLRAVAAARAAAGRRRPPGRPAAGGLLRPGPHQRSGRPGLRGRARMSVYAKYVLPRLTDLVMRSKADAAERAKLIPLASGVVLEVGIGSALNLSFYRPSVKKVYGVDPSRELWNIGRRRV